MEITDVKIRKIIPQGRLKAIISVTLDNMLTVHDVKVVQGDSRLFVAMPSRKDENGLFRDVVHPISVSARQHFEEIILDAYEKQRAMLELELEEAAMLEAADETNSSDVTEVSAGVSEQPSDELSGIVSDF